MIELRKINEDNFVEAFNLKLKKGQEAYVSHPIRSLAQAYIYRDQCQPLGIYVNEVMVGYVMVVYDRDVNEYNIWHLMIDERYQNKGYGSKAMDAVLHYIALKPFGKAARASLTCHKDNRKALQLYMSKGFKETGNADQDEIELYVDLNDHINTMCSWQFCDAFNLEFQNLFKEYFEELGISINDWDSVFNDIGSNELTRIVLFKECDYTVGFIIFEPFECNSWFFTKKEGFIREFYVAKKYRRQGYGTKLLEIVEDYFKTQDIYTIMLTTDTAEQFYVEHGYTYAKDVKSLNGDRVFVKYMTHD